MDQKHYVDIKGEGFWQTFSTKWVTVILSGLVLVSLNHLYWERRDAAAREQLILERKIGAFAQVQSSLVRLLVLASEVKHKVGNKP